MKIWKFLYQKYPKNNKDLLNILLNNRGLSFKKETDRFLNPPKPSELNLDDFGVDTIKLDKAVKRINQAKKGHEKVVVYTDYDTDGVCGGTIIWETLHKLHIDVMPYIPHRVSEGYGLSEKGIDKVIESYHPSLIITVDHGITSSEKIKYAARKGIDIIVIDHHVKSTASPAFAVVHTTRLCAAGVAWVFARELIKNADTYLDLVALATVADLVPLIGPNRSFVKYGLEKINSTRRVGLNALIKSAGLQKGKIGTYEVGFLLSPRINAMGRLMHALDAMRLLCTPDEERAYLLANKLNAINHQRQELTADSLAHAEVLFEKLKIQSKLIFIAHESYREGIIGLIAGKLVEKYYRPAIVISKGEVYSKASARSVAGFNIIETIRSASDLLIDCGGHPMAAGFTVKTEYIQAVQKKLEEITDKKLIGDLLINTLKIECPLQISMINRLLLKELNCLSPFGVGNSQPVFSSSNVAVNGVRLVGRESRHLKISLVADQGITIDAIGWNLGKLYPELLKTNTIDIAYTIEENKWNGNTSLQLKLKDVKMAKS